MKMKQVCTVALAVAVALGTSPAALALEVAVDTAADASTGTDIASAQTDDVTASGTLSAENTEIEIDCSAALDEPDALAEGWIESVFCDTTSYSASSESPTADAGSSGSALATLGTTGEELFGDDEVNLAIYESLESSIASVASSGGSTVFSMQQSFTTSADEFFESLDVTGVVGALCADCPFELYWYDKTTGVSLSASTSSSSATLTFTFAVIEDYADTSVTATGSDGETIYTCVSSEKAASAATAASNAKAIVSSLGDTESYDGDTTMMSVLEYYRDEICDLVSYNYDAVDDSWTGGYSDPWQLVYVFDGDGDTNVVCEGYSKAFQYLCDLTWSDTDVLECLSVGGEMSGGTGAGDHMWNLVRVAGHSYVCDVTNSDEGTIGEDGGLFLAGATDASTSTDGGYTFTISAGDGDGATSADVTYAYDDDTLALHSTSVLTLDETSFPTGTVTGATLGDDGLIELWAWDAQNSQAILSYASALTTYAVSGDGGTLAFTADASHLYVSVTDLAEGTYTLVLIATGYGAVFIVFTVASDGTLDDALLAESVDCDETGHTWDAGTSTATCTSAGETTWTCLVCGETKTEEAAALGHTWGSAVFTWAEDSTATAVLTCANDSSHITTATTALVTWTVTTAATATTAGVGTLTATLTVDESVFSESKEVEIAALGTQVAGAVAMSVSSDGALQVVADEESGGTSEDLAAQLQAVTLVTATSTYGISYVLGFDSSTGEVDTSILGAGDWTVTVMATGYEDVVSSLVMTAADDGTVGVGSVATTGGTVATAAAAASSASVSAKSKGAVKVKGRAKGGKTTKKVKVSATKLFKVTGTPTTLSYKVSSVKRGSKKVSGAQKRKFSLNAKTGALTVKKGVRKGTYTLEVKVTVDGTAGTVKVKLKVK